MPDLKTHRRGPGKVHICEAAAAERGFLQINVVNIENNFPISGAKVAITYESDEKPEEIVTTNQSGQTDVLTVSAPPAALSLEKENETRPYSEYRVNVTAPV